MDFEQMKAIPTYTLMRMAKPFLPPSHPWYNKDISLPDWTEHQTPLNRQLNTILWLNLLLVLFLLVTATFRYLL